MDEDCFVVNFSEVFNSGESGDGGVVKLISKMDRDNVRGAINANPERGETEIFVPENSTHLSVTAVLNYCKSKILKPYLKLLSITGIRPLISEQQEPCFCLDIVNYIYTLQVISLMGFGYFLQYMACFRRDRGFCQKAPEDSNFQLFQQQLSDIYDKTCNGSIIFSFVFPSILHMMGYLHAVVVFRSSDDEQLPVLMERVFLSSSNLPNGFRSQQKLVKILWWFILLGTFWMLLSLGSVNYMMAQGNITFLWIGNSSESVLIAMKVMLVICTLWHDIVQATVVSNYCIQAQLLTTYLHFLKEKLLQYPIQPLEWMKDIENFKKMLNYLNNEIAPAVGLLTFVNLSYSISGILWLLNFDHIDKETLPIVGLSIMNISLWILISIAPFIQAARLSTACEVIKTVGQEVRVRPFVHQDTPVYELDSVLMYTTSLNIKAKLFQLPITGKALCFFFTITGLILLVLGQCHYLISV